MAILDGRHQYAGICLILKTTLCIRQKYSKPNSRLNYEMSITSLPYGTERYLNTILYFTHATACSANVCTYAWRVHPRNNIVYSTAARTTFASVVHFLATRYHICIREHYTVDAGDLVYSWSPLLLGQRLSIQKFDNRIIEAAPLLAPRH